MRPRLVVLAYHAIGDHRHDAVLAKWSVRPETFAEQLRAIRDAGWSFVSLDDVLAGLEGGRLPARSVLVTFDDGYADLLSHVSPVLTELGIPAVAFVVTDRIGGRNEWDVARGAAPLPLLDADDLGRLAAGGIEIGSHSATHGALSESPQGWQEEIVGSAQRIAELGLPRARAFAYPYGDCPPGATSVLAVAGYQLAFTLGPGAVVPPHGCEPLMLPRVAVLGSDSARDLLVKVRSAAWRSRLRAAWWRLRRVEGWG